MKGNLNTTKVQINFMGLLKLCSIADIQLRLIHKVNIFCNLPLLRVYFTVKEGCGCSQKGEQGVSVWALCWNEDFVLFGPVRASGRYRAPSCRAWAVRRVWEQSGMDVQSRRTNEAQHAEARGKLRFCSWSTFKQNGFSVSLALPLLC